METPGERIQAARKQSGISQDKLAEITGVTRQTVTNWETGRTEPPLRTLVIIAKECGVTIDWIATGELPEMAEGVSIDEAALLRYYRRASDKIKPEILATVEEVSDTFRHGVPP